MVFDEEEPYVGYTVGRPESAMFDSLAYPISTPSELSDDSGTLGKTCWRDGTVRTSKTKSNNLHIIIL